MTERNLQTPLVSVIMPAYNAGKSIRSAVASVRHQTMENWELIVADDCSDDETGWIVEEIADEDPRVILVRSEENMGTARTRNRALDMCRGQYVAFLDSDDKWHPEKLEKQIALLEEKKAGLCYSSYAIVGSDGSKCCDDYLVPPSVTFQQLLKENCIGCSTVLLRRKLIKNHRFSEDFYHEDYLLWLQILKEGNAAVGVTQVLMDYCYRPDSRAGNKFASAKHRWEIYRDHLELPLAQSMGFMSHYMIQGLRKYRKR